MANCFQQLRNKHLKTLGIHIERGLVDKELVNWLLEINRCERLVTTSSCSGRITLHIGHEPLDKKTSKIIGSWHDPEESYHVLCSHSSVYRGNIASYKWISLQPPIIHILSPELNTVLLLLDLALKNGMRRSCIRRSKCGWMLEVKSGDKAIYFIEETVNCSFLNMIIEILKTYKKRMYQWMEDSLSALKT